MSELTISEIAGTSTTVGMAANGDAAAFARLVDRYQPSMAKVAYTVCGDPELARDATQQAWEIAWRSLRSLRDHGQVRAWLVAIAANEARQAVRRRRSRPVVDLSDRLDAAPGGDPADRIDTVDLARALAHLSADDRALIALRFLAGLDATEIAAGLRMSPSGVRSRLARLVQRLRTELDHA